MVYDKNPKAISGKKLPRETIVGKLIGVQGNSEKAKVFDKEKGIYSWLQLSIVVGKNVSDGSSIYKNVTIYDIKMEEMPELKKADDLIKEKKKPMISMQIYKVEKPAIDKATNQQLFEETTEEKDGKVYVRSKPKMWVNYRATEDDIKTSFKVLKDNVPDEEIEQIGEDVIIG